MREIHVSDISDTVARLCIESNYFLGEDVLNALRFYRDQENSPVGREVLDQILENARVAARAAVAAVPGLRPGRRLSRAGPGSAHRRRRPERGDRRRSAARLPGRLPAQIGRRPALLRPGQHQGQHTPDHPHRHRPRRQAAPHRRSQGRRQREHEPVGHAQAGRRPRRGHPLRGRFGPPRRRQPLPADHRRRGHRWHGREGHVAGQAFAPARGGPAAATTRKWPPWKPRSWSGSTAPASARRALAA